MRRGDQIRNFLLLIAPLAVLLFLAPLAGGAAGARKPAGDAPVLNVGHRGASGHAPEHTFASYDLALALGADYIEQDLQQTADGALVVLHDDTLDRTARGPAGNCAGPVRAKTLAQIKTCDVGTWFNETYPRYAKPEYAGERIPTLEEVFQRYGQRANYYIETKSPETADRMEERLLALLDEHGLREPARARRQVLIQSFSPTSLAKLHALDPALPLIQLFYSTETSASIGVRLDLTRGYAVGIGPAKEDADAGLVAAAHARCLDVHPYTVNEREELAALVAVGVDGIFTNFPDRLDEVLGKPAAGGDSVAGRAAAHRACLGR